MTALEPTLWYLIATAAALAAIHTTVRFFRADQPSAILMLLALNLYGIAFTLVYTMPTQPPAAVPIVINLALAAVVAPKVVRRIATRRNAHASHPAGPPDIEQAY